MKEKGESKQHEPLRRVTPSQEKPLQSWKEISAYLERDERTAQRWEKIAGLPIRRHRGGRGSSVYAFPNELDAWRVAQDPKTKRKQKRRWILSAAFGTICIVLGVWFIKYGPILNPPNSLVEAAEGLIFRQVLEGEGADIWGGNPSPDGRFFAYADWDNANGDLAIRDMDTGEVRNLIRDSSGTDYDNYVQEAVFSPDGQKIAYSWYKDVYELRMINADGTGQRELYRGESQWSVRPCSWSPDGKKILVHMHLGWLPRENQIAFISATDGSLEILKTLDWQYPTNLALSPNGQQVVYDYPADKQSTTHDLFLLNINNHQEATLISHPANDLVLGWVPGSRSILFASDRTGHWGIWMLTVDQEGQPTGQVKLIKKDTGPIRPLGFTQDGSFYYGIGRDQIDVFTAEIDFESGKVVSPPDTAIKHFMGTNQSPAWSPDGKYLAYTSVRSPVPNSTLLCIRSEDDGTVRELSPRLTQFRGLRWSPDGKSVLTVGTDLKGRRGAFLIEVQNGEVTSDFIRPDLPFPPEWIPGRNAIVFAAKDFEKTQSQIVWLELENGKEKKIGSLTQDSILNRVRISPDGSQLAARNFHSKDKSIDLVVCSIEGGPLKTLLTIKEPEGIFDLSWTADGKQVLFFKRTGEPSHESELWAVPVETGKPQKLGIQAGYILQLDVHPEGKRIVFGGYSRDDEPQVWVMEGLIPGTGNTERKD